MTHTVSFVDEGHEGIPSGAPAANASLCAVCGRELGAYDLVCLNCGTKLKRVPPADNLSARVRELRGIAAGAIANAMANMVAGRKLGVRLDVARNLLGSAQQAAMKGEFHVALELASRSGEESETQMIAFDALQVRTRRAQLLINAGREEGADMTEAERLLGMSLGAREAGDYRGALRYAIKAVQRADERRGGVTAWKVEIGDWLK